MFDTILNSLKDYKIGSVICFLVIMSPAFTYLILYNPDFISDYEYYIQILAVLIFSGCLFFVIYLVSLIFSTIIIDKLGIWPSLGDDDDKKNKLFDEINTLITSIFMLILTGIIIVSKVIKQGETKIPIEVVMPLATIGIYILIAIVCTIIYMYILFSNS